MFIFKPRSAPNDRFRLPKPMNGHKLGDKIEAISPNTLNVIGAISPNKNGKVRVFFRDGNIAINNYSMVCIVQLYMYYQFIIVVVAPPLKEGQQLW